MSDFAPAAIYGIIGFPLSHSLSPMLHTTAFRLLDIPAVLAPWPIKADKLPAFMEAFRLLNLQGACVTIPHKRSIMPLLDEITDRARAVGAVNLIYRRQGKIRGDNTDVPGFIEPLKADPPIPNPKTLILGCGGAARAAAAGLQAMGLMDITVVGRQPERLAQMAGDFGLKQAPWAERRSVKADLVVNCTPLGMKDGFEEQTGYEAEWFAGRPGIAYDVVYAPAETRFLREARQAGWRTIDGLAMFLGQADAQFFTWTGRHLPEGARQTAAKTLSARSEGERNEKPSNSNSHGLITVHPKP